MRWLKEAYDLLCEDYIRTVSVIIQLVIFITVVCISFGALAATNVFVKTTEKSGTLGDLYFFSGFDKPVIDGKNVSDVISEELGLKYTPVSPLYFTAKDSSGSFVRCDYFHCDKLRNLYLALHKGRLPNISSFNECVITYDLAIKNRLKTNDTILLMQSGTTFRLNIVGILDAKAQIPKFSVAGTSLTLKALYTSAENTVIVFSPIVSNSGTEAEYTANRCGFVNVPSGVSTKEYQEILEKYGGSLSVASMVLKEKEENREICSFFLVFAVLIFFVGFTGIGINNFLILQQNECKLGIYYICGMAWRNCFKILIFRNLLIVLISGVFSALISLFIGKTSFGKSIFISPVMTTNVTVLALLLVLFTSYPIYLKIKKTEPISFFRSGWQ